MLRFQYFSLRKLSGRIFWAFFTIAFLIFVSAIVMSYLLSFLDGANSRQVLKSRQLSDMQILQTIVSQQRNALSFVYNVPGGLEYIATTKASSATTVQGITENFLEPNGVTTSRFRSILASYNAISDRINANRGKTLTLAEDKQLYNSLGSDFERLDADIGVFLGQLGQETQSATQTYLSTLDTVRWSYLAMALVLLIIAIGLSIILTNILSVPFVRFSNRLRRMAAGDLTEQMSPLGMDETVEISLIFNRAIANLKLAITRIQSQTDGIDQISKQISRSSTNQVTYISEQAVSVSQVSTSVAELSDTSQNIADSATLVAESANNALGSANDGYETMLGASETMNDIRIKVNLIADRILALNSVAQRIREITLLIDTLSNETHLLALNAAIESAGAGEEGARFSVVAGHVRKLAQRSRVAAVEIQQLVNQIQHAAASSVMATEEGIKVVAVGEKMVSDSLRANENIIKQIGQTTQLAQAISQATEQQRVASNQVSDTMNQLSQISGNISQDGQDYTISAGELEEAVLQLYAIATAFLLQEQSALSSEDEQTIDRYLQAEAVNINVPESRALSS